MKVLDLFSGIGGFSLALERAGMQTTAFCEIDDYACRVLEKHWPDVPIFPDITQLNMRALHEPIDVVCGGFPCQPVSFAGKKRGDADERWLWPEFARIISETRPRWVVAENVPGLLSNDAGRLFGCVLRDLAVLGYGVEWYCIPAAAVGAPHIRNRVWIVAYAGGAGLEGRAKPETAWAIFAEFARSGGKNGKWAPESSVCRVVDGIPRRMDRLRCLGNAVVPQVVELLGKAIMASEDMNQLLGGGDE